ncbi:MAG: DinB family protein [Thermoanaerobaculia bacterium]
MTKYQDQLAELERLRGRLIERVSGVDSALLNRCPSGGGWSVAQIVAHVISAEGRSLAYLERKTQEAPERIPRAGVLGRFRSAALGWVLRSSIRVPAPPGAGEVPNAAELDELRADWEQVRAAWSGFLETFPTELENRAVYKHPVAGRMSLEQALRFLILHLERHSGQVERTLAAAP